MKKLLVAESASRRDEDEILTVIQLAMATYANWCPGWKVPSDLSERERARFREISPDATWRIIRDANRVVAVSRLVSEEPSTLSLLMVEPESWGEGIGSALHSDAIGWIEEQGSCFARLTVPAGNLRARRFYQRHGWQEGGGTIPQHPWLKLKMLEYVRPITA